MNNVFDFFSLQLLHKVLDGGANLLLALAIVWIGWLLAGQVSRLLQAALQRSARVDATLRPMLVSIAQWALKILALALALTQLGVQMAAIAALIGAAGLAIGLALQGTLQNIAAGIMLIVLRPFKVGDFIESDSGLSGTVLEIGLFNTQLEKPDGVLQFAPNSKLWAGTIVNYSRNPLRRLDIVLQIDFRADPNTALPLLNHYLQADARVLAEPQPKVMVSNVSNTYSEITLRAWSLSSDYWDLRYDLNAGLRRVLDQADISMVAPTAPVLSYEMRPKPAPAHPGMAPKQPTN